MENPNFSIAIIMVLSSIGYRYRGSGSFAQVVFLMIAEHVTRTFQTDWSRNREGGRSLTENKLIHQQKHNQAQRN